MLADGLRSRHAEIREAILDRLHAMEGDSPVRDAEYLKGLREAVTQGVGYGIEVIAHGERGAPLAPLPLVGQARLAARQGIALEMVLRRYLAGKALLNCFLLEEATRIALNDPVVIRDAMVAHEGAFDSILTKATEEYEREIEAKSISPDSRLVQRVRRLLDGEPVDPALLDYDLELNHLGLVALAPDVKPQLRQLAKSLGGRVLAVALPNSNKVWAWAGTAKPIVPQEVATLAEDAWSSPVPLGIGEPAAGASGWRRSHNQARAAAQIAAMSSGAATRYKNVALLASISSDPLVVESMRDLYLRPLGPMDHQGKTLRRTLLVYFAADRNRSSAAAVLGVSRPTVTRYLKVAEERLGKPVNECGDLLHAALYLEDLQQIP